MPGSEVGADVWVNEYISPWDIYAHGVTKILAHHTTPFQDMYIVESGSYGKALVLDGKWQSSVADEFLYHEPLVHPAMIHHGGPRRVLVLGGGEGATVREVLRWKTVEKVVMVDIDREVVDACRTHLAEMHQGAFDDPKTELVIGDALEFLDHTDTQWDVVISDLSDPIESGPSFKLFTKEYFEKVNGVLASGGAFVVQAGPVGPVEMGMHVRLHHTVRSVFKHVCSYSSHVPSYATPWGYLLARSRPIADRPNPHEVDALLAKQTRGGFRMLDGRTLLGMLQIPLHLREAIERETEIYTLDAPPRFFSGGNANASAATAMQS